MMGAAKESSPVTVADDGMRPWAFLAVGDLVRIRVGSGHEQSSRLGRFEGWYAATGEWDDERSPEIAWVYVFAHGKRALVHRSQLSFG